MSTNTAMCISVIRYFIKFKATQSEIVEQENAIIFIKYNKAFSYLVCTIVTILNSWFQIGFGFQVCTNELTVENWSFTLTFGLAFFTLILIQVVASIVCEVKLKKHCLSLTVDFVKSDKLYSYFQLYVSKKTCCFKMQV